MVRQSTPKTKTKDSPVAGVAALGDEATETETSVHATKTSTKRKAIAKEAGVEGDVEYRPPVEDDSNPAYPARKKRKTKAQKQKQEEEEEEEEEEQEDMPMAARTAVAGLKRTMYLGAHVSGAGGVHNSIQHAVSIGANAFGLFLKSQRKWANPPLADEARDEFRRMLKQHGYDAARHILPHGSYLVNLAQADDAKASQAYENFVDDLQRCEALGIRLYNFHPGSTGGDSMEAATGRIAAQLNKSHRATKSVITVVENMCGSGNVVGSRFEDLRDIISKIDDKSRVGVCIDTCHAFAAGYDLRSPQAFRETMEKFDAVVGLEYLKALHVNDSKAPLAGLRDLHANIGTGFLGLQAFHNLMNYEPFQNLPLILETPIDEKGPDGKKRVENRQIWADEIKLLESLIGADMDSPDLQAKAEELQAKGASERQRVQDQVDKKAGKPKKGTKRKKDEREDEDGHER